MWKTILRRIVIMIPQIILLSVLVFILAKLMPGDPFSGLIDPNISPERIEELRQKLGLYDPWYVQYFRWIGNLFNGDLGLSYTYKMKVTSIIGQRAYNTMILSLFSVLLSYSISIPLGILAGRYQDSVLDKTIIVYNYISYAIPSFILSLVMLWLFGYKLQLFPTGGSVDLGLNPGTFAYHINRIYHLVLPAVTYAILSTTATIQYLRNEVIDAKNMDYVKTARSKGIPEKVIYRKHIFRNSLLPIAAFLGYSITGLLGGSVFIETIFGYPGMGKLFIEAIGSYDYSIITALVLLYGILALFGTLLSDIILSIVDPRIRIE
ncbi:oligopeptide ABC transporter permease [Oceanivirga miroungae]|uniref:Binding-protein-dependent transport system inner membrane protein n=1 Tax=Oceanivirga miroungae TaxID=1130046 RepID=A0A6I8MBW5_9FUSO|nr:oligopeptide ABC transporter permease [Oceanivirga miroungae]VWL85693.1 binding-protein-dependent transport system inner membrane protein [Oceanivirga miroungae]